MPNAKITIAANAPPASQMPSATMAVTSMIRLAMGFPLPFTIDLLPDTVDQLRELPRRDSRLPAERDQLPRAFDDALIVTIDEGLLALLRCDKGAQAALESEQPLLLEIAVHACDRVRVDAERDGELAHGRERVARA